MAYITAYSHIEALVIDDMRMQQTTLRGQLAMLGIVKVETTGSAEDALRMIESKRYDLILCDYNLNQKTDGQQLFEYARERQLLGPDSLFFMITAENNYASVAAASEHMPDSYLLKPVTAGEIESRLKLQLDRREALLAIKQHLAKQDLPTALSACDEVLAKKDRWYMQALQLKGQIELDMDHVDAAKQVFKEALKLRPGLMWAQIGLARTFKAEGKYEEAKLLAQAIIKTPEGSKALAAYDVLAQSLEAQNDPQAALDVLKESAQIVPSARRHRQVAESAYRNGDLETANASYTLAIKSSQGSITAQPQDQMALAQTLVEQNEPQLALNTLKQTGNKNLRGAEFKAVELAIASQAHAQLGMKKEAEEEAAQALAAMSESKADFATVAVAKAALQSGMEEEGLKLLQGAVSADHENARIKQLITKTLNDTGNAAMIDRVVGAATALLQTRVSDAKKMFRDDKVNEALSLMQVALDEYPENTAVLLEATQMNCMALRRNKKADPTNIEQVRSYLTKLEKLMPASERVSQMRRYFRETLSLLKA
jgi:tetratricopeptide (TPR) repeat protein